MSETYEVSGYSSNYVVKSDGIYSKETGRRLIQHNFAKESYAIICIDDDYVAEVYGKCGNSYYDFVDPDEKATISMNLWVADDNGNLVEESITLLETSECPGNSYEIPGCHGPERFTVERYGNCFLAYINVYYGGDKKTCDDVGTLLFVCQSNDWKLSLLDDMKGDMNERAEADNLLCFGRNVVFDEDEFADILASKPGKTGAVSSDDVTAPTGGKLKAKQSGSEIVLTASGFKDNVGIDHYVYSLNGQEIADTSSTQYTYTLADGQAGTLEFTVRAYDAAGNSTKKAAKATVKIKDMTPPDQVTGLYMQDGADEKEAFLSWDEAEDNSGQIASYTICVDGKKAATSKTTSVILKKLKAGEHVFTVSATDKSKNTGLASRQYVFSIADITAPTGGKLKAKQSGSEIVLTVSGFKDNVGIDHYVYSLNGQEIADTSSAQYTYTLADGQAGKLEFTVLAYDAAGNGTKKAAKATVKIKDMTPPDQVTGLTGSRNADGKSVSLSWDVPNDNSDQIASYEIWVDGKKKTTSKINQVTIKGLSQESHTFAVLAVDAAKNKGELSSGVSVNLGKAYVLTGLDATDISGKNVYDDLFESRRHVDNWSASESGINALEVKENHVVEIDKITFCDGDASLTLKCATANSKHETELNVETLRFGDGNDLLEIQGDSECDTSKIDFGEGNNTVKLTGGAGNEECGDFDFQTVTFGSGDDKIIAMLNSEIDGGFVDFGAGNDSFLLEQGVDADFEGCDEEAGINFGAGNDLLQIKKGAVMEMRDCGSAAGIDFGAGNDTLILDGTLCLGEGASINHLEKVSGNGTLVIAEALLSSGGCDLSLFEKAGIDIVNTGDDANDNFTSREEELADNQKSKAISLLDWLGSSSKKNGYLCGGDWGHLYAAEDEADWFKLTIKDGEVGGYAGMSNYSDIGVDFDFYAANQNNALTSDSTIDFSDYSDGTYYIRLRVDSSSAPANVHICMHDSL